MIARVATELNLPAAYFYATENDEAELLERYYRMSNAGKAQLMECLNDLK